MYTSITNVTTRGKKQINTPQSIHFDESRSERVLASKITEVSFLLDDKLNVLNTVGNSSLYEGGASIDIVLYDGGLSEVVEMEYNDTGLMKVFFFSLSRPKNDVPLSSTISSLEVSTTIMRKAKTVLKMLFCCLTSKKYFFDELSIVCSSSQNFFSSMLIL